MRFKQYILNESRSKRINTEAKCKDLLNKHCITALKEYKKGNIIYRGTNNGNDFIYIDSKIGKPRESANTKNYYTLINDNSPYWKKYPKRSKSIICTTSKSNAYAYGYLYYVFPYDGAKIGVCSSADYWLSFYKTIKNDLSNWNDNISLIADDLDIKLNTIDDIKKFCKKFDNTVKDNIKFKDDYEKNDNMKWLNYYNPKEGLYKYIQKLFDPKTNDFKLMKIGDTLPKSREVWTDSESIMVYNDNIDVIVNDALALGF